MEAYIKARLQLVEPALRGELDEDDLEVPDRIEEQLEQLPGLCRYQYEQTRTTILAAMDPLMQRCVWVPPDMIIV